MCHLTHTCSVLVIDSRTGKPRAYRARPWPSGSLPANSANPGALSNAPHPASVLRTGILSLPTQNSSFLTRHGTKDLWFKNPFFVTKEEEKYSKTNKRTCNKPHQSQKQSQNNIHPAWPPAVWIIENFQTSSFRTLFGTAEANKNKKKVETTTRP